MYPIIPVLFILLVLIYYAYVYFQWTLTSDVEVCGRVSCTWQSVRSFQLPLVTQRSELTHLGKRAPFMEVDDPDVCQPPKSNVGQ